MKKLGVWLLAAGLVSGLAYADGMVIRPHVDGWRPLREGTQEAIIFHRNGVQRMLLAIQVENPDASDMVWLLPIPASPNQVALDILSGFPRVHGTEVFGGAGNVLRETMTPVAIGMQVWPVAVVAAYLFVDSLFAPDYGPRSKAPAAAKKAEATAAKKSAPPLTVHQHVEKAGMVSEVITAREGGALYQYLAHKGLVIKPGALPVLEHYVGKDYSFVASWIGGGRGEAAPAREQDPAFVRGIDIRFPSREIFFPLRPTSIYGDAVVPAILRVAGYVTPRPFADIASHVRTGYHVSESRSSGSSAFATDFDKAANGRYTKIDISAPSARFTDDLWIDTSSPVGVGLAAATFIASYPIVAFFLLIAAISVFVSVITGWALLEELRSRNGVIRLACVGLANCLTFIGIAVAAFRMLPGTKKRIAGFLAGFSIIFIATAFFVMFGVAGLFDAAQPSKIEGWTHIPPPGK